MARSNSRYCYNCLFFPYKKGLCDTCSDIKLNNWVRGSFDYKPYFMNFSRYIPNSFFESEDFDEKT